jgi:glucan endo-1,3-beta-D-glucosidase
MAFWFSRVDVARPGLLIPLLSALLISFVSASGTYQGFNYGSVYTDNSAIIQSDYQNLFTTAQNLVGTSGFTSARLFTMIQAGTTNTPTEAIPAAIDTGTSLLLGLWASAGSASFNNEVAALSSAISQYGTKFTSLIAGIAVGSEDLYRNSPIGISNNAGIGTNPSDILAYIAQVRSAIANTAASNVLVGHVDTWTVWVNSSNDAVISACDFIGMDSYPYFETTTANAIQDGYDVFFQTLNSTQAAVGTKPVWITETGWPVSGVASNLAVASIPNAQTYWDQVGCVLFGNINTWWYTLQDSYPQTPTPSFGIVGSQLSTTPLFNLTCPAVQQPSPNTQPASVSSTPPTASSPAPPGANSTNTPGKVLGANSSNTPASTIAPSNKEIPPGPAVGIAIGSLIAGFLMGFAAGWFLTRRPPPAAPPNTEVVANPPERLRAAPVPDPDAEVMGQAG